MQRIKGNICKLKYLVCRIYKDPVQVNTTKTHNNLEMIREFKQEFF